MTTSSFHKGALVRHIKFDGESGIVGKIKGTKIQVLDLHSKKVVGWYSKKNLYKTPR